MTRMVFDYFTREALEGREEGIFSLELHLYDEKEDTENAILEPVDMQTRLGEKQVILISGDTSSGFTAELAADQ